MKNTILKYPERTGIINGKEYVVPDYFQKDINVKDFLGTIGTNQLFINKILQNNDKLERVAYENYQNQDYWDVILLINGMDPLFSMPIDDEYVLLEQNKTIDKIFENMNISQQRQDELREEFIEEFLEKASSKRYIKMIPTQKISEFLDILKKNKFV